ncbi:hypothetical protein [Neorhodopirellula pilleata]|uniref:hypothetical protein n=1 Tax=Neorhodopirellula pilleata TaxID=2714738 RepID=UPI0011B6D008|nr:hypothetical protein [Neorhodopirellula pilleata]
MKRQPESPQVAWCSLGPPLDQPIREAIVLLVHQEGRRVPSTFLRVRCTAWFRPSFVLVLSIAVLVLARKTMEIEPIAVERWFSHRGNSVGMELQ